MSHIGGETTSGDRPRVNQSGSRKGNGNEKGGDPRRVQELRTALEGGKYRVEPRKVADKIIRDAVRVIRGRLR